ncbi:MAG: sigma-54-dependent Fis family transcriptional regulator, partial [Anaerolineales bacterium]|nr:sigma-54-dependent Fis family transcriptional regulator [Anaerolineales bacterium]
MKIGLVIQNSSWTDELTEMLRPDGHQLIPAKSINKALSQGIELVFAQWIGGVDLPVLLAGLRVAAEQSPPVPVVVLVQTGEITALQRARAAGATDVLLWPASTQEIHAEIADAAGQNAVEDLTQRRKLRDLASDNLVGESPKFKQCLEDLLLASRGEANVLLLGETGTGKEMMARAIHQLSRRASNPFVVVNCPALKDTLWESELFGHAKGAFTGADSNRQGRCQAAGAGILMLDEIGYLGLPQQATLLRLIDQRTFQRLGETSDLIFHARIISATSVDVDQAVRKGKFRQDLLGRLDQFRITIPPLRERRSDIAALAMRFLRKHSRGKLVEISPSVLEILEHYDYPRNVREV